MCHIHQMSDPCMACNYNHYYAHDSLYMDRQWCQRNSQRNLVDYLNQLQNHQQEKKETMSTKYYRVKKDTFVWKEGAVIKLVDNDYYTALEDVWCVVPELLGRINHKYIEHENNVEYFERVYPDTVTGKLYKTKDQLVDMYKEAFKK